MIYNEGRPWLVVVVCSVSSGSFIVFVVGIKKVGNFGGILPQV